MRLGDPKITNQSEFYDEKKYSEILKPKSDLEKELWSEIENAEQPIRNILKRINRLSLEKFPDAQFITEQSCTGHVNGKGELEKEIFNAALFVEDVEGEEPTKSVDRYLDPGITFRTFQNNEDIKNLDDNNVNNFLGFFKELFIVSVDAVNKKFNENVIMLELIRQKAIFQFSIQNRKNAHQILKDFWSTLESKLGEFDEIKYKTNFEKANFLRDSWSREKQ